MVGTATAANPGGWSRQKVFVAMFAAAFMVVQLAVPILALAGPRPARFGWQMYTALVSFPEVSVEGADGRITSVDVAGLVASGRADANFSTAIAEHLCRTTSATAVHLRANAIEERVTCQ